MTSSSEPKFTLTSVSLERSPFSLTLPSNGGVSICLIGSSRSGKTTLMKHLYREYFKKHMTVMFSMNTQAEIYEDLGEKVLISPSYHPTLLKEAHEINVVCKNKHPFLFISDDYVDHAIKNDKEVTRLLTIYRNSNMSSIFSFQGNTLMSAAGRNSCNYICIFKQQTPKAWKAIIEEFLDMWLPLGWTMAQKISYCKSVTGDHSFFFIDNIEGCACISKLTAAQIA